MIMEISVNRGGLGQKRDGRAAGRQPPPLRLREPREAPVPVPAPRGPRGSPLARPLDPAAGPRPRVHCKAPPPSSLETVDPSGSSSSSSSGRGMEAVAFMAEVGGNEEGCPGEGVIEGPRVCGCRCDWIDPRRHVIMSGYGMGASFVVDSVTGRQEDLRVQGMSSAVSNGHWAVLRTVWGRAWVADLRESRRRGCDGAALFGGKVEVGGMDPREAVRSERFVSENVMSVVCQETGVRFTCKLVDVERSFANRSWAVMDSVTVLEELEFVIKQVSCCWDRRTIFALKQPRASWTKKLLFTADASGTVRTIPTGDPTSVLLLESFFVIQSPAQHHQQKLEAWSFQDLAKPRCVIEIPREAVVSCSGDFLAVATSSSTGRFRQAFERLEATTVQVFDVSCGRNLFTIHARNGYSLVVSPSGPSLHKCSVLYA
ncbi:hypothetical protein Pelo_11863 [Pelomyxa schiedti]|nr:hypothetical protein Pelo_11863 [Pelomyxa schiedti]